MKTTTVTLPNGSTAVMLVPVDTTDLAIVHLPVIKRLAGLLPKANPRLITRDIIQELTDNEHSLERVVSIMEEHVSFHKTVNLITEYIPEDVKDMLIGKDNYPIQSEEVLDTL